MINILKTDFYKAFRTTSFWVILIINILYTVFFSFCLFVSYLFILESHELTDIMFDTTIPNFFQSVPSILTGSTFLIGIFAIMFFTSDFTYGTIKNIASKGYRRAYIYLSKFITVLTFAAIYLFLSFITSFFTAQIVVNSKIPEFFNFDNNFIQSMSKYSLQLVTYISIAVLLAVLFRSLGPSIATFLGFIFFESSISELINKLIHYIFKSDFSVIPYTINGAFSNSAQTTQGIIVLLIYIIAAFAIGLYTFEKCDIN